MPPNKSLVLASVLVAALVFPALSVRGQDTNESPEGRGSAPRSSAEKYKAHANHDGVSIGAELLTRKDVSKEFASDLNRCCVVVQVAVYPKTDETLNLSRDDFSLRVAGTDTVVRPLSPSEVSAKLQRKTNPDTPVITSASGGIGYEVGTHPDPVTGQPVHGHTLTTSVSVAGAAGRVASPAASEGDREAIERELNEKGLPQTKISVPVSGYLYFSLPKRKNDAKYRLEYGVKGSSLSLPLP